MKNLLHSIKYFGLSTFCLLSTMLCGENASQEFLDTHQYSPHSILRYERVFGAGFVSTGGIDTTKEFVAKLDLKVGQKVLDIGCGIGGGDFYMANEYGVTVRGVDLSKNMIHFAKQKAIEQEGDFTFEIEDITTADYPS